MSVDNARQGGSAESVEAPAAAQGRSISLWFLVVPIALAMAVAALAFFLLSPRDEDLMTTADPEAVAAAVQSARPAEPAFTAEPATPATATSDAAANAAAEADPSGLDATNTTTP